MDWGLGDEPRRVSWSGFRLGDNLIAFSKTRPLHSRRWEEGGNPCAETGLSLSQLSTMALMLKFGSFKGDGCIGLHVLFSLA